MLVRSDSRAIFLDRRRHSGAAAGKLRALRQDSRTRSIPIIALIDQGAERDYVDLLKSGIDDIFIRPMLPAKLVERLNALTRDPPRGAAGRSEEHTSELQSLMRISYAVFCLKKKRLVVNNTYRQHKTTQCYNISTCKT